MPTPEPPRARDAAEADADADADADDHDDTRDEAPAPDDPFGYLTDFDLERDDALRRLADLEAAALEEVEREDFDAIDLATADSTAGSTVDLMAGSTADSSTAGSTADSTADSTAGSKAGSKAGSTVDPTAAPIRDSRARVLDMIFDEGAAAVWRATPRALDDDETLDPTDEDDGWRDSAASTDKLEAEDDSWRDSDAATDKLEAEDDGWRDPDAVADRLEAEDDAAFDQPSVRDAIETGSAFTSTAFADASELGNLELRHQRPSPWGRLDLTIAWRRRWTPHPATIGFGPLPHGPIATSYDTADSLLVLATWSR